MLIQIHSNLLDYYLVTYSGKPFYFQKSYFQIFLLTSKSLVIDVSSI